MPCGSPTVCLPGVRLLLHPLRSGSLAILSYQGRKTGCWRRPPCMHARDG